MKKFFLTGLGLSAVFAMTSCKSSESAYKKAYEKAKQQVVTEQEPTRTDTVTQVEVTPVIAEPTPDAAAVKEVTENVTVVSGGGLKAYSVVCGSFSLQANAEGLQKTLSNAGYNAQIAKNEEKNMYRVVAATYDDRASAIQTRNALRSTYPDVWLLLSK